MNAILWWAAQNTITIAISIPIVAAACRLCRNRPAVRHVLWAVVLLKFLTPNLVFWPWPVQRFSPTVGSNMALESNPRRTDPLERRVVEVNDTPIEARTLAAIVDLHRVSPRVPVEAARQSRLFANRGLLERTALGLLIGAWSIGIVICTVRQARRIRRLASLVRRAKEAPEQLTTEIEAIAIVVGLRPPRALVTRGIVSPFMWFMGRLRLVWPETMSECNELVRSRGVIAHELAHVRRGDHYLAWAELLAGLLWWWNPLFWFVRRRLRESAEQACDAIALATHPASRRTYAELLLELSSGSGALSLAPVLGIRAGSSTSFERRLSMVLSDRVSGNLPAWGLVAAASLALVSLPGWSLAQKPAESRGASSDSSAKMDEPSGKATAARLEQVESELKRLSRLLEQAKLPFAKEPQGPGARPPSDMTSHWRKLKGIAKNPSYISFEGSTRNYFVTSSEKYASLRALNKNGDRIWNTQLPGPFPAGTAGVEWALRESDDLKQGLVTRIGSGQRITFRISTETGTVFMHDVRPRADEDEGISDDAGAQKRTAWRSDAVNQESSTLAFGRGQNRIYVLNVEQDECFLSVLTDHASQVWYRAFRNPTQASGFEQAWHDASNGQLPGGRIAGGWTIEESDDRKLVVVSWEGRGVHVRLCFDIANGNLLTEEFTPGRGPQEGDPAPKDRGSRPVARPTR